MESKDIKILLVDDKEENLLLFENILKNQSFKLYSCTESKQAVEKCNKIIFDLILMDVRMPISGFETIDLIQKSSLNTHSPIIYIVEKTDFDSISMAYHKGCLDVIAKPFNTYDVLSKINSHIRLVQQHTQLKELIRDKERTISLVAHELRSPFNTLLGFSDLLMNNFSKNEKDENKMFIEKINAISNQTHALLSDLLDYSMSQQNKILKKTVMIDIPNLINEVVKGLKFTAELKNITINVYKSQIPVVQGDDQMLSTMVRNILTNAIKFTPNDGNIDIISSAKYDQVQIIIKDSGIGMEKEIIDSLFDHEKRITRRGTNNEKGTGYGLLICKDIIEKHKGSIEIISEVGKGSSFEINLPVVF